MYVNTFIYRYAAYNISFSFKTFSGISHKYKVMLFC